MPRVKIKDLPKNASISQAEMTNVLGGIDSEPILKQGIIVTSPIMPRGVVPYEPLMPTAKADIFSGW